MISKLTVLGSVVGVFLASFISLELLAVSTCFAEPTSSTPTVSTRKVVQFTNSNLFDAELHDALKAEPDEVRVDPISRFTIEELPSPILKWLAAVRGKGGGYVFINESKPSTNQTESSELALLLFSVIKEVWDAIKELILYNPAKNYKAQIFYKSDTDHTVTKIIFMRWSE